MSNLTEGRKKRNSDNRPMNSRCKVDRLAILRLSLKSLEKPGNPSAPSVVNLRRVIENRIVELETSPSVQWTHAVLDVKCPVCEQPPGLPCVSVPLRAHFGGKKLIMKQPHRQRFGQPIAAEQ
jgi:hypothetical protein